jgi:hypothetical protein
VIDWFKWLLSGCVWWRLQGFNPGGMMAPKPSEWRRNNTDPYFYDFLTESGYPYIPADHPRHNPPWHESWVSPPHLSLVSTRSLRRPDA